MGVIVKFSPRIYIDLTGAPDRYWGSAPLDPLASVAPSFFDMFQMARVCFSVHRLDHWPVHGLTRTASRSNRSTARNTATGYKLHGSVGHRPAARISRLMVLPCFRVDTASLVAPRM